MYIAKADRKTTKEYDRQQAPSGRPAASYIRQLPQPTPTSHASTPESSTASLIAKIGGQTRNQGEIRREKSRNIAPSHRRWRGDGIGWSTGAKPQRKERNRRKMAMLVREGNPLPGGTVEWIGIERGTP